MALQHNKTITVQTTTQSISSNILAMTMKGSKSTSELYNHFMCLLQKNVKSILKTNNKKEEFLNHRRISDNSIKPNKKTSSKSSIKLNKLDRTKHDKTNTIIKEKLINKSSPKKSNNREVKKVCIKISKNHEKKSTLSIKRSRNFHHFKTEKYIEVGETKIGMLNFNLITPASKNYFYN